MVTASAMQVRGAVAYAGGGGAEPAQSPASVKRVLVAEDNPLSMKLFNDLLEAHGYATLRAETGPQALDLARTGRPDLILMDLQLPDLSGFEVIRRLKDDAGTGSIPIIAMTASAIPGVERQAMDSGCDAFIEKPINVDRFLRVVAQHLAVPSR